MAVVRFGEDSDVYVYQTGDGKFACVGCGYLNSIDEVIQHLKEHIVNGDKVPDYAFDSLERRRKNVH